MLRAGGFGGSLCPQGISTTSPNPPWVKRNLGMKGQRAGGTAASHGGEIPIQKSQSDPQVTPRGHRER